MYSRTSKKTPNRNEVKQMIQGTMLMIGISMVITVMILFGIVD